MFCSTEHLLFQREPSASSEPQFSALRPRAFPSPAPADAICVVLFGAAGPKGSEVNGCRASSTGQPPVWGANARRLHWRGGGVPRGFPSRPPAPPSLPRRAEIRPNRTRSSLHNDPNESRFAGLDHLKPFAERPFWQQISPSQRVMVVPWLLLTSQKQCVDLDFTFSRPSRPHGLCGGICHSGGEANFSQASADDVSGDGGEKKQSWPLETAPHHVRLGNSVNLPRLFPPVSTSLRCTSQIFGRAVAWRIAAPPPPHLPCCFNAKWWEATGGFVSKIKTPLPPSGEAFWPQKQNKTKKKTVTLIRPVITGPRSRRGPLPLSPHIVSLLCFAILLWFFFLFPFLSFDSGGLKRNRPDCLAWGKIS